jgi:hypothetical protein
VTFAIAICAVSIILTTIFKKPLLPVPKIYDNIETHLTTGLNETLEVSNRTDLCVGYFNLRRWREIGGKIDNLCGENVDEDGQEIHRCCRLLVGMQKMPVDILKEHFSHDEHAIDQSEALKLKKKLAQDFKEQLTIGTPTEEDEKSAKEVKPANEG